MKIALARLPQRTGRSGLEQRQYIGLIWKHTPERVVGVFGKSVRFFDRNDVRMRIEHLFQEGRSGAGVTTQQNQTTTRILERGSVIPPALQHFSGDVGSHCFESGTVFLQQSE